ncbi:MAG TPA: hypothetical protein VK599_23080 [Streptosporangiaceae bacterium]|jgi:uncharacterized protein YukE|nr:hypothetical protein [Streptosporangiaceae bacterium]
MSDLMVDFSILQTTEKTLTSLHAEFSDIKAQERVYDSEWGSGDVKDAMHSFTDNWDDHRKNLLNTISNVGKLVSESISAFQQTDGKLADGVTKKK